MTITVMGWNKHLIGICLRLSQGNRFLRTHFLTAKARDASIGIYWGILSIMDKADTGSDQCRCLRRCIFKSCLRAKERAIVDHRLHGFAALERFPTQGRQLESII